MPEIRESDPDCYLGGWVEHTRPASGRDAFGGVGVSAVPGFWLELILEG